MEAENPVRVLILTVALLTAVLGTGVAIFAQNPRQNPVQKPAQSPAPSAPQASDDAIRRVLVQRVDDYHQAVGIVVGVIDAKGRRIVSYGAAATGDARPLTGETVFEIGSITKVFTSLLLADMVRKGEVALTDPVAKYLPATVKMPTRGDRQITLQDLASHSSGLPGIPSNFKPANPMNPYADYTTAQLYQFLSSYELTRDIGSQYEYSNLGGALLGQALALRAGKDYETLVRERITGPLNMRDTRIALSDEMKSRLAPGHSAKLDPVPNWDLPAFAGAGALRSTANDLLEFLAVSLGYRESPLAASFATMYAPRRPAGMPGMEVALAWHIKKTSSGEIIWHNGGTGGYRTFAGFDPRTRTGVVVLSNTSNSVDDIGFHLLDAEIPLAPAPKVHTEKTVDPKIFDKYTGRYQLRPDFVLSITTENNHLMAQATGQRSFELFAEGEREFFAKVADIQIVFEVDDQGRATSLTLIQGAARLNAKRID
jgi:D-alanyl-D-alanine-carboxypeptidase/D-alanyl-D-alanine-endopeptidase